MTMKRILLVISATTLAAAGISARDSDLDRELGRLTEKIILDMNAAGESRVAFLDFVDLDGRTTRFGRFLVEELRGRFYDSRRFTVVERRSLDDVLEEQNLQLSGLFTDESVVRIGQLVGANALVTGHIADVGDEVRIHVRLVSVDSGTVFSHARAVVPKDDMVRELMEDVIAEAPDADWEQGSDIVLERTTAEERESLVNTEGFGPFDGSWLLNGTIAMTLVQNGDEVAGKYDRGSGSLRGSVRGQTLAFEWTESGPNRDGTVLNGRGEMTLGEDGMRLDGACLWDTGRHREGWGAIRSKTDPVVERLVAESRETNRGRWGGLWLENTSRTVEIFHTGNKLSGLWENDGAVMYGFVRGDSVSFYKVFQSDRQDGTLVAVAGEAVMDEDGMMFTGRTQWAGGRHHGEFLGIRSIEDRLVEEHIDSAKDGRRGDFGGRWLVNGNDGLRIYQNDDLIYGRRSGNQTEMWGFVRGATIRFYQVGETAERDGTLQASMGTVTLSEDEMTLDGQVRWPNGRHREDFNGIRSLDDPRVEELIEWADDAPRGGFTGKWVLNDGQAMDAGQTDEYFHASWDGNVLFGTVQGHSVSFYGIGESPRNDGTYVAFRGEGRLSDDGLAVSGQTKWSNGRFRSDWKGHRRLGDAAVAEHREAAENDPEGPYSGMWNLEGVGALALLHAGDRIVGTVRETGETIYGFVSGRVLTFYGLKEEIDGTQSGFTGEMTMDEAGRSFTAELRHINGRFRGRWQGSLR